MKILTFSYDDGVTQDIRLIDLFNKYGISTNAKGAAYYLDSTFSCYLY